MKKTETPVQKNEYVTLHIDDLSHEGLGVGKVDGFTLFVKHALPGETIEAKVIRVRKNFGYACLMKIVQQSPARAEPRCSIYALCGGCQLQHLSYEQQLQQKTKLAMDNLQRIGKVQDVEGIVKPTLGMENPWRYRNKAQVPVGTLNGKSVAGFYRQGTHDIVPMDECLIQHERGDSAVQQVIRLAQELGISVYAENEHSGFLRHVLVKYAFATEQMMIVLITNGRQFGQKQRLIERLRSQFPELRSIVQNINTRKSNVIMGEHTEILWGEPYIYDKIGQVTVAISARSFYQVNPVQTKVLYEKVLEYADLSGHETVIDAYCGVGTIALFLAGNAREVKGIELVPEAIEDAKRNARVNGFDNVAFTVGRAEEILPRWAQHGQRMDVVVVDPPRKGCDRALLDTIIQADPAKLIYVSCNPSTLARDVHILEQGGYTLQEVQPVDMFPQTMHVEAVALLQR